MGVLVVVFVLLQAMPGGDTVSPNARSNAQNSALPVADRRQAYEQLIRNNPSDQTLYSDYASLLIANRDYSQALTWISKGLKVAPRNNDLRFRKGIALRALNRYQESLKILEVLPASGESRFYMGLDCRALGDHRSAQKYLVEARQLGFRDEYAWYSLIEEDHALGDKAGLEHFRAFLSEFPDSPWLHVLYGNAYVQKDDDADGIKEYREALRLKPDLPAVNFRLGFLLYKDSQYTEAAGCFRKELALNPSYSDANLFLGQTLRSLGQSEEAVAHLRKAVELDRRSELAYRALIATLSQTGDFEDAAQVLRTAEKEFPTDPSFPAQLAGVLTRLNREEEALKEQEKFRRLQDANRPKPVERNK